MKTKSITQPADTRKKKRIYLTKARRAAFSELLSMDDILYENYRRIMERIHTEEKRLATKARIARIVRKGKDYDEILKVLNVIPTVEGTIIYVE